MSTPLPPISKLFRLDNPDIAEMSETWSPTIKDKLSRFFNEAKSSISSYFPLIFNDYSVFNFPKLENEYTPSLHGVEKVRSLS